MQKRPGAGDSHNERQPVVKCRGGLRVAVCPSIGYVATCESGVLNMYLCNGARRLSAKGIMASLLAFHPSGEHLVAAGLRDRLKP